MEMIKMRRNKCIFDTIERNILLLFVVSEMGQGRSTMI